MKESTSPAFAALSLQRYWTAVDIGFNAAVVGVAPGTTGNALLVEGLSTFTVQYLVNGSGSMFAVTVDPNDDTTLLSDQLVLNFVSGAGAYQAINFGGPAAVLTGQVWRNMKLRFIAAAGTITVTTRLFGRA